MDWFKTPLLKEVYRTPEFAAWFGRALTAGEIQAVVSSISPTDTLADIRQSDLENGAAPTMNWHSEFLAGRDQRQLDLWNDILAYSGKGGLPGHNIMMLFKELVAFVDSKQIPDVFVVDAETSEKLQQALKEMKDE